MKNLPLFLAIGALFSMLFFNICSYETGKNEGFIKGCETAMIDIYNDLNIPNINKDSLRKFCKDKS